MKLSISCRCWAHGDGWIFILIWDCSREFLQFGCQFVKIGAPDDIEELLWGDLRLSNICELLSHVLQQRSAHSRVFTNNRRRTGEITAVGKPVALSFGPRALSAIEQLSERRHNIAKAEHLPGGVL